MYDIIWQSLRRIVVELKRLSYISYSELYLAAFSILLHTSEIACMSKKSNGDFIKITARNERYSLTA